MIDGIEYLQRPNWQMTFGERSALEGLVSHLRPALAIEVGTAEGGSLATIAAYSEHVHSFDLVEPQAAAAALPNVTIHTGDSHATLPRFLAELAHEGRQVDFMLVDGDHTADGVRRDAEDLLAAPALARTVVVFHDTANDEVRGGLDAVDWDASDKLAYLDLDFVPGYAVTGGPFAGGSWGGLGVAVVDAERVRERGRDAAPPFLPAIRAVLAWREAQRVASDEHAAAAAPAPAEGAPDADSLAELGRLRSENEALRRSIDELRHSSSWRLTAPLRAGRQIARERLR